MNSLRIKLLKTFVHTVGRLSDGIRIACEDGFTSGRMVDYVYRNQPSGVGPLGKLLDRIYLSNKGWEAVRIRRLHLEQLLESVIRRQVNAFGDVFILDVASGQARYLREALARFVGEKVEALCWDVDNRWLEEGQEAAAKEGLGSILYDRGNALDAASFARLPRAPHIVVASGLYEWVEDDRLVQKSLKLVFDALPAGGCFLFTMQTGHVALEMTNEVFPGFGGGALRIRPRPAASVHDWARRAGFEIERTVADDWHYHAVTLACKLMRRSGRGAHAAKGRRIPRP